MTWFNHLQFTGGTSFQKNLLDLHRIVGVGANVAWDANGAEISVAAPNFVQVYDLGVDYASVSRRLDADVLAPIVSSIDAGHRGAYLVAHHINAPGVLMIEGFLDRLRGELERRDCDLAMASLARDPVAHRLSAKLKFDEALSNTFDPSLGALRERDPTFPVGDGNHPFAQMREFLFMDVLTSEEDDRRMREMIAADASRALVGADAETAPDAFATIRAVAATAEARATQGMPHATVEGVLRHPVAGVAGEGVVEGGGEWAARFADARAAATSVANNFVAKWDVSLLSTEDQREALLRLADEMDWHPELLRGVGGDSDAFAGVQGSTVRSQLDATLNDALNTHGGAKTVDVASLPRDFSRALAGWTALDAALYLTAVAQKAASEAEASARFGTPDAIAARVGEARTPGTRRGGLARGRRGGARGRGGGEDARRRRRARRSQGREGGRGRGGVRDRGGGDRGERGVPPGGARRRSGIARGAATKRGGGDSGASGGAGGGGGGSGGSRGGRGDERGGASGGRGGDERGGASGGRGGDERGGASGGRGGGERGGAPAAASLPGASEAAAIPGGEPRAAVAAGPPRAGRETPCTDSSSSDEVATAADDRRPRQTTSGNELASREGEGMIPLLIITSREHNARTTTLFSRRRPRPPSRFPPTLVYVSIGAASATGPHSHPPSPPSFFFFARTSPSENCGIHARRARSETFGPLRWYTASDMARTLPARSSTRTDPRGHGVPAALSASAATGYDAAPTRGEFWRRRRPRGPRGRGDDTPGIPPGILLPGILPPGILPPGILPGILPGIPTRWGTATRARPRSLRSRRRARSTC